MSRIILIGCGKAKLDKPACAMDLYTGPLFRAGREYAETSGDPWHIFSAAYGLVDPFWWIEPYDKTIADKKLVDRIAWHVGVLAQLLDQLPDCFDRPHECSLEVHAGIAYREPFMDLARAAGFSCHSPTENLQIGQRIAWFKEETRRNRIMRGGEETKTDRSDTPTGGSSPTTPPVGFSVKSQN